MEAAYYALLIYFITGARLWIGELLSPSLSWECFLGVGLGSFTAYIFYDLYWVTRSINFMIDNEIKEFSQLYQKEAEPQR